MNKSVFTYAKVRDVKSPTRGTCGSAGLDFFVPNNFTQKVINPDEDILIPSGIKANIPEGYMLLGIDKSGIASSDLAKSLIGVAPYTNKPSLIIGAKLVDEDYQGEIHIHIINVGSTPYTIKPGTKIAQFVLIPVLYAEPIEVAEEALYDQVTDRGNGGFGSTGIK
ncbi:MAG: hypothetical protein K2G70_05910 [Turicibacter sp.]|nr:hypothetical protein [Turicibacter sp.]